MAFPATDLPDPSTWFSNALITSALMKSNIIDAINLLPRGNLGEGTSASTVTLSSIADFAGLGPVTFVLGSQRRVRIVTQSTFNPNAASATARYRLRAGYNSGGSVVLGSFVQVGQPYDLADTTAQAGSASLEGTVLLAAGTYTAYGVQRRAAGGAATDTASTFYTAVFDVGAS